MSNPVKRVDELDLLERAARAVGKVDAPGMRGVTTLSAEEIEAMALSLAILNFPQIAPGQQVEDRRAFFNEKLKLMEQTNEQ